MDVMEALIMPDSSGFELAVLSVDSGIRPIFCFPHSGEEQAEKLARILPADELAGLTYYSHRRWLPLMISKDNGRWLALRSLLGVANVMPVIDPNSPRWRQLDLSRIPMDALCFAEGGSCEMILYEGDSLTQSVDARVNHPLGRLAACAAHSGSMQAAADCICALADIMGCGLELVCAPDDGRSDVAVGVASAMALYMLMLCLRAGADRSCRVCLDRRDGEVAVSFDFELCPDEFYHSDGEEWAEITACRRLADAHNVSFEYEVERGGVRCRFCPACREWSRLGVKLPTDLEYD